MRLRCFPPHGAPTDFDLGGSLTIGRDKKCDITISDDKASSKHAVIEVTRSGKVQLRDLQSTNGTLMNGAKVEADLLTAGDVVLIGEHRFMLWEQKRAPVLPADDPKGWRLVPRDDEHGVATCGVLGSLTVGRSPECGLPIDHATVSAHHATITVQEHGLTVEDHGSSNGTWVGGTKVRRSALKHGDIVAFGDVAFFAQHGNRELPQVKAAERKTITLAAVAVVSIVAAGIFGITVLQNQGATPAPAPAPSPSGNGTPAPEGQAIVETKARVGTMTMDRQGLFGVTATQGAAIKGGAVVLLDDSGRITAQQHEALPGKQRHSLRAGRTAEGYLAPTSPNPVPFKLSGGSTPSGYLTLAAAFGAAGEDVIGGVRLDLATGATPVSADGPGGVTPIGGGFAIEEVNQIVLDISGQPFTLSFDAPWSVKGRPAGTGWELLIWKRGSNELTLGLVLGEKPLTVQRELAKIRSRAEAAMQREAYAEAVTLWTELLGRYTDGDPEIPELTIRLDEAKAAAKKN